MADGVVIVGAGHAGATLAAALRQKGFDGPVTLIGGEAHHPYHRPPLSKALLLGSTRPDRILLRPPEFYDEQGIDLRLGRQAVAIDRKAHTVTLDDGEAIPYRHLVLATGTRARMPPLEGIDLPGVHSLRTLADSAAFADQLAEGARLVILGAGYIGLEVAAAARERGVEVAVVERMARVLARVASPVVSEWVEARHRERGVTFLFGRTAVRLTGTGAVDGVELDDGTRLPADVVLVGIGAEPVTELAAAAGLAVANGIVVDEALRTSDPDILAIGDCTAYRCAFTGGARRLESVQNAQDQARVAAALLAGEADARYEAVPWFWSDQGPDKLQSAGLPEPDDDLEVLGDVEAGRFTVLHRRDGVIVASESVNDARNHMLSRRWIAERGREVA